MSATALTKNGERVRTRRQGRVLLVTDDPAMKVYSRELERAGFAVVGVEGGAAALISIRRTRPHIVVASTKLKGIGAEELARMLAQAQEGLPLLMIGDEGATLNRRQSALSAGAFDYFQLPSELPLLLGRIRQLVELAHEIDRLRADADLDYLTGLVTRRRFRNALGQEVERWRRYKTPCALLIVDIDFMKRINDTHGHSAGDVVIRHVASVLAEHSRDNDTAARLGGEEFALLLAGADEAKAAAAAERVRQSVSSLPLEGIGIVTVSLGVASCPAHANSERTLYAATDAALYQAKREGRDRAHLAPAIVDSKA